MRQAEGWAEGCHCGECGEQAKREEAEGQDQDQDQDGSGSGSRSDDNEDGDGEGVRDSRNGSSKGKEKEAAARGEGPPERAWLQIGGYDGVVPVGDDDLQEQGRERAGWETLHEETVHELALDFEEELVV